jgi:hypothetical protein
LQSELLEQWLQLPFEQVPWPLQSELLEQWPQVPLEHVPNPAQSEFDEQYGSAWGASRISAGEPGSITVDTRWSGANDGVATVVVAAG